MSIDITTMDYAQLADLRARIEERMVEMRENGVPELRSKFSQQAAALGLSIDDVLGQPKKRRAISKTPNADDAA